jgi:uncharacterized protein
MRCLRSPEFTRGVFTKHPQAIRQLALLFLGVTLLFGRAASAAAEKPKVRAITAFVRLDRAKYQAQVQEALQMLRKARDAYEKAGYEVQTIRISTQPFPEYTKGMSKEQALAFFHEYDLLAQQGGFDAAIGPAMLAASDDPRNGDLLAEVLRSTKALNASVVAAGDDGVHWNAVRAAARVMKFLEEHTPHSQGNFNFAATALVPPLTPFYPGSYHTGIGHQFAIALQSANVVAEALVSAQGPVEARRALATALVEQTRAIETIAQKLDLETGWQYMGIDLSPAPLKEVSIVDAMESYSGVKFGAGGTLTTAALITDALGDIGTKRVGYSGLMLPVLEDAVLAQRWSEGAIHLDALLAYSAVCGTGLDTIPLPGDVTEQQLERIIGDMASLAVKLHKPLSARLLPVTGKKPGERTEFDDPFLVNAVIQPLPPQ